MGVITAISLEEINSLFPTYNFMNIMPTSEGIMDTTYIVSNSEKSFILKKYERDMGEKIQRDAELLKELNAVGLNVPLLIDSSNGWYLYKKLSGTQPKVIKSYHIQALARFMAEFHQQTNKKSSKTLFLESYELEKILCFTKKNFYIYFKKLQSLQNYKPKNEGFIHGDIFKDNTVFHRTKIGVFDFIDGGSGEFIFDIAVALVAFDARKHPLFISLFLNTYNQKSPKKIEKEKLIKMMELASKFYALLRIDKYKNPKKAKELL